MADRLPDWLHFFEHFENTGRDPEGRGARCNLKELVLGTASTVWWDGLIKPGRVGRILAIMDVLVQSVPILQ
jgi:hypothetical protein